MYKALSQSKHIFWSINALVMNEFRVDYIPSCDL